VQTMSCLRHRAGLRGRRTSRAAPAMSQRSYAIIPLSFSIPAPDFERRAVILSRALSGRMHRGSLSRNSGTKTARFPIPLRSARGRYPHKRPSTPVRMPLDLQADTDLEDRAPLRLHRPAICPTHRRPRSTCVRSTLEHCYPAQTQSP